MEAGSSGFSAMAPPVFDGENYQAWAVKITAFMEGCDLWEAVEEDYKVAPLPNNPTMAQIKLHKEKKTRKAKAKSCLYAAVSPTIFTRVMRLESAKAIWDYLKEEYEGDEKIRGMKVLNLLREFERLQMEERETVKEFADKLVEIANKIRVLETDLSDSRLVQKLLVSVPERYEATIASLENTKELSDLKFVEVLSALQALEQRRMMRREEPVEGALQAKVKQGNPANNQGSMSSDAGDGKVYTDPCKHCGKKSHPQFRCWRRPDVKCRKCHKMGHVERICREQHHHFGEAQTAAANEMKSKVDDNQSVKGITLLADKQQSCNIADAVAFLEVAGEEEGKADKRVMVAIKEELAILEPNTKFDLEGSPEVFQVPKQENKVYELKETPTA
ncbi:uncharacterized protein LOC116200504 [Punica granatum]|uniref:Uncharacterized protein LOC116200504 n=1 Tax=Punica granatum TaxID=22663 RepID=A0A6P8D7A4_PUNGR|nr:uncharacterized protein LOC116200504 [Punica granatum]